MRVYCIDASSLIDLKRWRLSAKRNRLVWERLEQLISADRLIAPEAVFKEIQRGDDELVEWAKAQRSMFKTTSPEHVQIVQKILRKFPNLVDRNRPGPQADSFVVALAYDVSGKRLGEERIVVTHETYEPNSQKIPNVCEAYKLQYLTIHQMFLAEGWAL